VAQNDVRVEEVTIAIGLTRARLHVRNRKWIHLGFTFHLRRASAGERTPDSREFSAVSYQFQVDAPFVEMTMNWR
jgi:hypothetical protein